MSFSSRYGLDGLRGLQGEAWALFAIRTLNSFGFSMAMPFFGLYLLEVRGINLAATGAVYFAAGVFTLASRLVGGRLTDAVGPRRVMLAGYYASIAASVIQGFMVLDNSPIIFFFVSYPLFSFLRGLSHPATGSIIAGQPVSQIRSGYNLLTIGGNLGFAIGPALGGPITDAFGYAIVFFISAAMIVPVILLTVFRISGGVRASEDPREGPSRRLLSWKEDRNIIGFLLLAAGLFFAVGYEIQPMALYVAYFLHFTNTEIGYLFATNGGVIVLLQLPLINMVQKARTLVLPLLLSPLLLVASFLMAGLSTGFLQYEAVMVVLTLGEVMATVPSQTVMALFSRSGNRGTYQGYYYAATSSGRSTAAAVGPASFQLLSFDPAWGWYALAAFVMVVFAGFTLVGPRLQRDYEGLSNGEGGVEAEGKAPGIEPPAKSSPLNP
ncbi:MAG: MFS transporter [Nitrososphaerota archaeon]|nr:MFS transporter [Nitrososphaerota archaeon]